MRIVKPKSKKFWIPFIILVIVAVIVLVLVLRHNHKVNEAAKKAASKNGYSTTKTHKPNSGNPSSTSSSSAVPGGSLGQGGATDNKGSSTLSAPNSQWTTASSGLLSVHQPAANSTVTTGTVLSGTAQVSTVYFRVISDSVGVVAQGSLSVVNNNFSGTLNFRSQTGSGRLDVYSYDSNGVETNEVQIPVQLR